MPTPIQILWLDGSVPPGGGFPSQGAIWTSKSSDNGATWSAKKQIYVLLTNPPPGFNPADPATIIQQVSVGNPVGSDMVAQISNSSLQLQIWRIPLTGTPTPTAIDGTHRPVITEDISILIGPFKFTDSKEYLFAQQTIGPTSVYQSADGITWVILDAAHQPPVFACAIYDGSSTLIRFAYQRTSDHAAVLTEFNLTTGLWTAAHDPDTGITSGNAVSNIAYAPNGSTILFYSAGTFAADLQLSWLSGGTWTDAIRVSDNVPGGVNRLGNTAQLATVIVDQNSIAHIFYGYNGNPGGVNNNHQYYRQFNMATGVMSAVLFSFPAAFGILGPGNAMGTGLVLNNNTLALPVVYDPTLTGSAPLLPAVYLGTPLNAPVWSVVEVDTDTVNDAAALPILSFAGGTPPSLTCPVSGAASVGAPYSGQLVASGGTAPYTYAIIGGALPAGLTLNASTGLISGIPTGHSGVFPYTAQVTDANGLSATANCQIIVSQNAQLIFQGVRRQKGSLPPLIDPKCYKPKAFTYVGALTINSLGTFPAELQSANPQTLVIPVTDYDFVLDELEITYSSAGSVPPVVCAMYFYDPVKNQISNLPVLDVFLNGALGSLYQNGSQVPPLIYPQNSELRLDVWSLVKNSAILPITATFHFVGKQLVPTTG